VLSYHQRSNSLEDAGLGAPAAGATVRTQAHVCNAEFIFPGFLVLLGT
jgi:hypothetical protein